jgi:hypothetical protein
VNDGRPPDTVESLAAVDKKQQKKSKKNKPNRKGGSKPSLFQPAVVPSVISTASLSVTPQSLISYEWSGGNSCFFDVGLALWFEAFSRWPQHAREHLLKSLPSETVLASVFNHYERRNKWLATRNGNLGDGQRELSLGQGMARHGIFNQFNLYESANVYGCSRTWLTRGVMVRNSDYCPSICHINASHFPGASGSCPDSLWSSTSPLICLFRRPLIVVPCLKARCHPLHYPQRC